MILVDTNVLLDLVESDRAWADWSQYQLEAASLRGALAINAMVYTELSMAFSRIEQLDRAVADAGLEFLAIPREAVFLAGKALLDYRKRKGLRRGVLPDFSSVPMPRWPTCRC